MANDLENNAATDLETYAATDSATDAATDASGRVGERRGAPLERVPAASWWALAVAASAFTIISINVTGTNIAFAEIQKTFTTTSRATLSWALSGYNIALASFMVLGGRLADGLGRRRVFFAGVWVFLVGSLACFAAPVGLAFVAGRIVQGLGGALVVPSSLALVLPEFPASRRTSAVAVWTASGSTGAAVAPSLSAFVVDAFGWRVVYLLSVPIALGALVAGRRLLRESRAASSAQRMDLLGMPMGTVAIGLVAFAIVEGPKWGWLSPGIAASLIAAAVLFPAFVLRSLRHPAPLMNLRIFRVRTVWTANVANVFMSMMGLSIWLVWPLFLTGIWGYSLVEAGLAITPGPICSAVSGVLAGRLADRHGPRLLIGVGSLFPAFVMIWMALRFGPEPHYWSVFFPAVTMFGLGFGLTFSPLNGAALKGVDAGAFGEVNAAFNTVRNLAGGLGVAIVVALLGENDPIPFANFDRVYYVMAFLSALPALVIAFGYPREGASS
ncbi:MAG: MFS transporter [Acidimicrobiia bacterium]|nr:MFS transporter [Acidimicrobiia bacterium]